MKFKILFVFVLILLYNISNFSLCSHFVLLEEGDQNEKFSYINGALSSHNRYTQNAFSSFLGLKENSEEKTEELSKLSTMMSTVMMTSCPNNRSKKRYTEDG